MIYVQGPSVASTSEANRPHKGFGRHLSSYLISYAATTNLLLIPAGKRLIVEELVMTVSSVDTGTTAASGHNTWCSIDLANKSLAGLVSASTILLACVVGPVSVNPNLIHDNNARLSTPLEIYSGSTPTQIIWSYRESAAAGVGFFSCASATIKGWLN